MVAALALLSLAGLLLFARSQKGGTSGAIGIAIGLTTIPLGIAVLWLLALTIGWWTIAAFVGLSVLVGMLMPRDAPRCVGEHAAIDRRSRDPAMRRWLGLALLALTALAIAGPRSPALRAEFMRLHPCPSTGATRGACPGYQVDHREALICGGRDELANLQWLTIEEHKAKTRVEVKLCRPRSR